MRTKIVIILALFLMALMPGGLPAARATTSTNGEIDQPTRTSVLEAYAGLPLLFIRNQGQLDSQVEYYVRTPGQTVYLTPSGLVFDLIRYQDTAAGDPAGKKAGRLAFSLGFIGANAGPLIQGGDRDKAVVNYLTGDDPREWHTGIPTCREVTYKDVYPGIDLRLYGRQGVLEYEFIVQPGSNISGITLAYAGVDSLNVESGELVAGTAFGDIRQGRPYIYQQIGDDQVAVAGGFRLLGAKGYGFEVGAYDAGYPLVIDPPLSLAYSTYLGGDGNDGGYDIAVESGCAYVTGYTDSDNFPTKNQYQTDNGTTDAFVAKLDTNQSGTASLIYSTYLGGSGSDSGHGIAVESGCAYVTGETWSSNFPRLNQYQNYQAGSDAFVARLNTTGDNITYSTFLGGSANDFGEDIAVESGCAYVTGNTASTDFPNFNEYQTDKVSTDAFVAKLDTTQSGAASLIYSTYLGGGDEDKGHGIAVESGCAYVTGETNSTDFPTWNQFQTDNTTTDAFVTKFNTTGDNVIYSTYLGGSGADIAWGIAVESGYAYVTGYTTSTDFPTLNRYQSCQGGNDAFVTKLNTDGGGLIYSTYLGGNNTDEGTAIAVKSGYAYITGHTLSTDFPRRNKYQDDQSDTDAFMTRLNTTGDNITHSTYLGDGGDERGYGIAVESGCAYVTGFTDSDDFPTWSQYQSENKTRDSFITKFNTIASITVNSPDGGESWTAGSSQTVTWSSSDLTGNVDILISRDGGAHYAYLIPDTTNDGSQAWTVTEPATTQARIGVQSHDYQTVHDASDADFTITGPTITVTSPDGGESWAAGTSQTVTWTSSGVTGNVDVLISRDGGATGYNYLISDTSNDGSQAWVVTGPATAQARIVVQSHDNQLIYDSSDANFAITCTAPGAPSLSSPAIGATVSGASGTFTWAAGTGSPTKYWLEINSSSSWGSATRKYYAEVSGTSKTVTTLPASGATLYWRVQPYNACGWGTWSLTRNFINSAACTVPGAPSLSSPAIGATVSGASGTFTWAAGTGVPTRYWLEINSSNTWGSTTRKYYADVGNVLSKTVTTLPANGSTLYWRVQPYNACGWGTWSLTRNFINSAGCTTPGAPTLSSPANAGTVSGASGTFTWAAGTGVPTRYWLEINSSASWGSGTRVYYAEVSGTSKTVTTLPANGSTLYWRVQPYNACGWGTWSLTRNFVNSAGCTTPGAPTLNLPLNAGTVSGTSSTFTWTAGTGSPTKYWLEINSSSSWGSGTRVYYADVGNVLSKTVTTLPAKGATLYWRVQPYNACGWGTWSLIRNFVNGS